MSEHLRRAGPGKFEGGLAIDAWAYDISQTGCDEECGSVQENGWHGRLDGPFRADGPMLDITRVAIDEHGITLDEIAFLERQAGVILHEDSQGFVSADWYEDQSKLNAAWEVIEAVDRDWHDEDNNEEES